MINGGFSLQVAAIVVFDGLLMLLSNIFNLFETL